MKPKYKFCLGMFPPVVGLLLSLPPYIPGLEKTMLGVISSLFVFGFLFITLFLFDYLRKEMKSNERGKFFRFLLVNFTLWGYFFGFICISILVFDGGVFGPKFVRSEDFPDLKTSIYVYDTSFFGKSVSIKVKDKKFPYFSRELAILQDVDPTGMMILREKDSIRIVPPMGKIIIYNSSTGQTFREN